MRYSRIALILVSCSALVRAQAIITTIAGGGVFPVTGIGGPAANVPLGTIQGVTTDSQGNVYAADSLNHMVVKITTDGVLSILAGNGTAGYSGDGGPAPQASFVGPVAVAADASGNVYVLDSGIDQPGAPTGGLCVVRKIAASGIISTFAGTATGCGYSAGGGAATAAPLAEPQGIAVDTKGNLYIADTGAGLIRKVTPDGIISTVAGNGQCCYTGDGVPATSTALGGPYGVAVDPNGVVYIADTYNDRIRRVGTDGIITTIAGGNGLGYFGDGGPATAAMLNWPAAFALDGAGDIYVADMFNHRVRRITPDGVIRTIAGTGTANFTGDQGQASLATLNTPSGVAVDAAGNTYIADSLNFRVRKIDRSGTITTYAGNGNYGFAGDGGQARNAVLNTPSDVLVDSVGNIYISDTGNNRVRRIAPDGVITTVAGGGAAGFAGDGGPATQALLNQPLGLALDSAGNLYIADSGNRRVRKVDSNGTITTFAGSSASSVNGNGDGGPAVNASFGSVNDIALDAMGNLYVADTSSIRRVAPGGLIATFAPQVFNSHAIAVDTVGNVYDSLTPLQFSTGSGVLRISPSGSTSSFTGGVTIPGKMAIDSQGNVYIPDAYVSSSHVIVVSPSGAETVIAGTGQYGLSGDEGLATLAQLGGPTAVALDSTGNLYIADSGNNRIREVFLNPATGLFQPALQTTLQPGYYLATVTLGQSQQPGYWGMQILAPAGVLAGGLNLGGTIQQSTQPPAFGGVYLPTAQALHVHIDAQAADSSSSSTVALGVQILDASNNPVMTEQFGGTSLDFTQPLSAGYYGVLVTGGTNSPNENFQMALSAPYFQGGVDVGGFAAPNSVGFGAFYLTAAQQVNIQIYGQPSYGVNGAGGLRLTLYDANRNVIATVP